MLRFEAIAHNTAELRCGRMINKFPEIVTRLAGVVERFTTALDCVDTGFLGEDILDRLPTGSTLGATRVGGVDLNKPRMRDALRAALALAPAPNGFTVAEFTAKVHALTGQPPHRLQRPPGRLRPTQTAGQTPCRQAGPNPPLPRPAPGRAHHRRAAHPPRPGHRPDPRRVAQPAHGTQTRALDPRRPRL